MAASREARHRARSTILTSFAQVTVLLGAALLGILIARRFGTSSATDGFFAANAIYAIVLLLAQSLRTTSVARLIEPQGGFGRFNAHLAAIGLIWLGAGAVFLFAGVGVAAASESDAYGLAFEHALFALWPAAGLHLFAGLGAAMLATFEDYATPAWAYAGGTVGSLVGFAVLVPAIGVDGVAPALTTGALVSAAAIGWGLARHGWRPRRERRGGAAHSAGALVLGGVALIGAQALLSISVALAAMTGAGNATLYSYAAMLSVLLSAGLASPISVVFAPVVAREWDRRPATLVPLAVRAFRVGAILLVPAVALLALVGPEPAHFVLRKVGVADISLIFDLLLVLSGGVLAGQLLIIPMLGLLTEQRFAALAARSAAVVALHAAASGAVVALGGGPLELALVATGSACAFCAAIVRLALGGEARRLWAAAARAVGSLVLPGAVGFALAGLVLDPADRLAPGVAAFALGLLADLAWLHWRHRDEIAMIAATVRPDRA